MKVHGNVFPLRDKSVKLTATTVNAGTESDAFVETFLPGQMKSDIYVVSKVVGKKTVDGKVWYQVKWQGYKRRSWEPKENLMDHGGSDAVYDYEKKHATGNVMAMKWGGKVLKGTAPTKGDEAAT